MLFALVFMPGIAALAILLCGRFFNKTGVIAIALSGLAIALFCYVTLIFDFLIYGNYSKIILSPILNNVSLTITYVICYDYLSLILLAVVLIISLLVHIYSISYMFHDPHFTRFFGYLLLFTFFMLLLLVASDMYVFFIGWEGVGLCSYLLISFWFTRTQANISALKAFFLNRIGDCFFLVGLTLVISICKTVNYQLIIIITFILNNFTLKFGGYSLSIIFFFGLCLFIGACSKSAQIFLHTWLPDAMEGPTPVSALIHAATMVAAGIFLIIKLSFLILNNELLKTVIIFIGGLTVIFAATSGYFQNDIKKIIAYSTCSQLGYMAVAAGMGLFSTSMFHLTTHAFFKALLFLVSGAIIHSMADVQDIRRFGGLILLMPLTYVFLFIGSISLIGIPFTSGYYSKDLIIEFFFNCKKSGVNQLVLNFLLLGVFFTVLYSSKVIYITFFLSPRINYNQFVKISENHPLLLFVLGVLAFFGLIVGKLINSYFSFFSLELWVNSISLLPLAYLVQSDFIAYYNRHLITYLTCFAVFVLFFLLSLITSKITKFLPVVGHNTIAFKSYYFFSKKWYFDNIYNFFFSYNVLQVSYFFLLRNLEFGFFEATLPYFLNFSFSKLSKIVNDFNTSLFWNYINYLIFGIITIMFFSFSFYYLLKISIILILLLSIFDLFFDKLITNEKKKMISIFFNRRQLLVQRNIWRFMFLCVYYFSFLISTLCAYIVIVYVILYYIKYGEILPSWLIF